MKVKISLLGESLDKIKFDLTAEDNRDELIIHKLVKRKHLRSGDFKITRASLSFVPGRRSKEFSPTKLEIVI